MCVVCLWCVWFDVCVVSAVCGMRYEACGGVVCVICGVCGMRHVCVWVSGMRHVLCVYGMCVVCVV